MTKRKKPHTSGTSGGERICAPKLPKKPKLSNSNGTPECPVLSYLPAPEGKVGPATPAEHSEEELRLATPSLSNEETEVPFRLLEQPEKDPFPFPLSQNAVGKFIPQFVKPRKTVIRKTETKEEDIRSGAFNLETLQEPSALQVESQQLPVSPGLALPEEGGPEHQAQATGTFQEQHSQLPQELVVGGGTSPFMTFNNSSPSCGTVLSAPGRASREHLSEPGTCGENSRSESSFLLEQRGNSRLGTERGLAPEASGQKVPPPTSESEGKEWHRGAPSEKGGVPGALGSDPVQRLIPVSQGPEPGSATQGYPDHVQTPSRPVVIVTDGSTDPTMPPPGALEAPRQHEQAPNNCTVALPHSLEVEGGREAEPEAEPPGNAAGPPAASLALAQENREPVVGGGDSGPLIPEVGPGVDLKQMASPGQEELGGPCALPSPEPLGRKVAELGSKSQSDPKPSGYSLSHGAASSPEHEVVNGLSQGPGAHPTLHSADQAFWGGSSPMELDFLPDSQLQDALDAPDFKAPLEQLSPLGSRPSPCWPSTSPPTSRALVTVAQPRTQTLENPRLEDATSTVCGLIMELSNLKHTCFPSRLIMSTHRDLEALKRLSYWKAKPSGRAPAPYASKGAGSLPRGEQPWRDA